MITGVRIITGDCIETMRSLPDQSVHCVVTSPPYFGLRDYGVDGQIGLEDTPQAFVARLVDVFREVRRVLRDDGTCWVNLGDSYVSHDPGGYREGEFLNPGGRQSKESQGARNKAGTYVAGLKRKNLIGIPWRVAFALQDDGWYLRQDIICHKPNPMPESVRDRCTKAHEYLFLLTKQPRYWWDAEAMKEPFADKRMGASGAKALPYSVGSGRGDTLADGAKKGLRVSPGGSGRNRRSVWTVTTKPFKGAHFATFPPDLIEPCILAGCPPGGIVLDPFGGAGTTGLVALRHGRGAILCELSLEYVAIAEARIAEEQTRIAKAKAEKDAAPELFDWEAVNG